MTRRKHAPRSVQHSWVEGRRPERDVWICCTCKTWTANLPLYRYEVCDKRDRRKRKADRRKK